MPETINVLFLAAEADPFVKIGGLGDVAGSLPRALRALRADITGGVRLDVRLALPLHSVVRREAFNLRPLVIFPLGQGGREIQAQAFETTLDGMPVYFIHGEPIEASGSVYSSNTVLDGEKYAFFSLAALELTRQLSWKPDILHANDWHTALAAYAGLMARRSGELAPAGSVLTIHNLPFLGPDLTDVLKTYGLPVPQTDLPEWAQAMPLPLGLWAADAIVAVSPSYAAELLTPEYGCGLEAFIYRRRQNLQGILNGIDVDSYNPATDEALAAPFGIVTLSERAANKEALQEKLGLMRDPNLPLLGVVSRLDPQKGIDLIPEALRKLKDLPWQAVILGAGDPAITDAIERLQVDFPDRVRAELRYDAKLARQIYAGADLLLMPSRYEPCGLAQMIAMRYGCLPLVHATGGLKDTVRNGETGFVFTKPTAAKLRDAIRKVLRAYPDRAAWEAMQRAAMSQNFSWASSALQYFQLYKSLVS